MEIEGILKVIGETKTFGNNGFEKREIVVTTSDQYPQHIAVDFIKDKCELIEKYSIGVGDQVKVSINLLGREWTSPQGEVRYFNSIQGWRIEKISNGATEPKEPIKPQLMTPQQAFEPAGELNNPDDQDPLPF